MRESICQVISQICDISRLGVSFWPMQLLPNPKEGSRLGLLREILRTHRNSSEEYFNLHQNYTITQPPLVEEHSSFHVNPEDRRLYSAATYRSRNLYDFYTETQLWKQIYELNVNK